MHSLSLLNSAICNTHGVTDSMSQKECGWLPRKLSPLAALCFACPRPHGPFLRRRLLTGSSLCTCRPPSPSLRLVFLQKTSSPFRHPWDMAYLFVVRHLHQNVRSVSTGGLCFSRRMFWTDACVKRPTSPPPPPNS